MRRLCSILVDVAALAALIAVISLALDWGLK